MLRLVKTENGLVEGLPAADPRITSFKGIPFAAPPVGENRWRAPMPCKDWDGVLKAYRFAPISMQDTPGIGDNIYIREWHVDPDVPMNEDCLYLNVWTNAKSPDEKLPVVVWYFGGGLQWGYPSEMEFDGERVARRGVVVVTVNYRIGVFGFLTHPEITKEAPDAPANFGSLDQQAGLRWVYRNIAAFGGDPENITIAGQSAGGGSVMSQLVCKDNFPLIKKAIVQSAMIRDPYTGFGVGIPKHLSEEEKHGEEFFDFLGVKSLKEARELDAFYIRDRYAVYAENHERFFTVQDDKFCVGDPMTLFAQNKRAMVPIMAGNTSDEFPNMINAANDEEFETKVREIFGDKADEFIRICKEKGAMNPGEYGFVNGIECTVKAISMINKELGNDVDCFYYKFGTDIPGWDNPGNFHSVELWFFFETLAKCWRPFKGYHYDMARIMCNYWSNFIKTGNPNGKDADGTDMPEWLPYSKENPNGVLFGKGGVVSSIDGEEDEFIAFLANHIKERIERNAK